MVSQRFAKFFQNEFNRKFHWADSQILTQVSLGGLPDHQRFDSTVIRFLILKNSERSAELIRLVGKWVSGMCVCGVFGEKKVCLVPPISL